MKIRRTIALIIATVGVFIGLYFASAYDAGDIAFLDSIMGLAVSMGIVTVGICWYDVLNK